MQDKKDLMLIYRELQDFAEKNLGSGVNINIQQTEYVELCISFSIKPNNLHEINNLISVIKFHVGAIEFDDDDVLIMPGVDGKTLDIEISI